MGGSPEWNEMVRVSDSAMELSLNHRQTCDIELLLNGGFSPLTGFMTSSEYNGVVNNMHCTLCVPIGDENGWTTRSHLALSDPKELWMHSFHFGSRSCGTRCQQQRR